jgi:hypothetical protein
MSAMPTDTYYDAPAPLLPERRPGLEVCVVKDPAPGELVEVGAGSRLDVRFAGGGLLARWEVLSRPRHLVPLTLTRSSFSFVVFRTDEPVQELVLRRTGGARGGETRVLRVVTTD